VEFVWKEKQHINCLKQEMIGTRKDSKDAHTSEDLNTKRRSDENQKNTENKDMFQLLNQNSFATENGDMERIQNKKRACLL
jgi:hypothetical protein